MQVTTDDKNTRLRPKIVSVGRTDIEPVPGKKARRHAGWSKNDGRDAAEMERYGYGGAGSSASGPEPAQPHPTLTHLLSAFCCPPTSAFFSLSRRIITSTALSLDDIFFRSPESCYCLYSTRSPSPPRRILNRFPLSTSPLLAYPTVTMGAHSAIWQGKPCMTAVRSLLNWL